MKLKDLNRDPENLKKATLCFLVKKGKVLLAMKKRGFGVGKWNGVGGKVTERESIENTALRETKEEINVLARMLKKVAVLNFYFENKSDWDQSVTAFIVDDWVGEPKETEEMKPKWFAISEIPYEKMWWDDKFWLPRALDGKKIRASFLFDDTEKVIDHEIEIIEKFV